MYMYMYMYMYKAHVWLPATRMFLHVHIMYIHVRVLYIQSTLHGIILVFPCFDHLPTLGVIHGHDVHVHMMCTVCTCIYMYIVHVQ